MEYLTEAEIKVVEDLGRIVVTISEEISGRNPITHTADMTEIVNHIHAVQNWVLAQAAARALPGQFRRLGAVCEDDDPTPINEALEREYERSGTMTREEWNERFRDGTRV